MTAWRCPVHPCGEASESTTPPSCPTHGDGMVRAEPVARRLSRLGSSGYVKVGAR
ncbi:MAG TPA: hypothetical protein VGJ13_05150 [Pseudonocardiaceae bacterium]